LNYLEGPQFKDPLYKHNFE